MQMLTNQLLFFSSRQKIMNTDVKNKNKKAIASFSISAKFLGMHIDNDLTLNVHTKHINTTISKGVGVYSRPKN